MSRLTQPRQSVPARGPDAGCSPQKRRRRVICLRMTPIVFEVNAMHRPVSAALALVLFTFIVACETQTSTTTSTGVGDAGSGGGGASADACGADGGTACGPDAFCDNPMDLCGKTSFVGPPQCKPRPSACDAYAQPTCGCDGHVYGNACEANLAGVDAASLGGCVPPAGTFACGAIFCSEASEYCYTFGEGAVDTAECRPLPPACFEGDGPSCACLADVPSVAPCQETDDGGLAIHDHI